MICCDHCAETDAETPMETHHYCQTCSENVHVTAGNIRDRNLLDNEVRIKIVVETNVDRYEHSKVFYKRDVTSPTLGTGRLVFLNTCEMLSEVCHTEVVKNVVEGKNVPT